MASTESKQAHGIINGADIKKKLGDVLFVIERNIDDELVVYQAVMNEKKDDIVGIKMWWSKQSNLAEKEDVGEAAKRIFYGPQLRKVKRGQYLMQVNCLMDEKNPQIIDLRIKKSGHVVPYVTIKDKRCQLHKIFIDITLAPPSLNGLYITGEFQGNTMNLKVPVTPEMVSQVDFSEFLELSI